MKPNYSEEEEEKKFKMNEIFFFTKFSKNIHHGLTFRCSSSMGLVWIFFFFFLYGTHDMMLRWSSWSSSLSSSTKIDQFFLSIYCYIFNDVIADTQLWKTVFYFFFLSMSKFFFTNFFIHSSDLIDLFNGEMKMSKNMTRISIDLKIERCFFLV